MRNTKIVCTIGPASESPEMLEKLMDAGMNIARLNFSHGDHEEHRARITNIRKAADKLGHTVAILLDTKGPEIRTHTMENGEIELSKGQKITVSMEEVVGTPEKFSVTYAGLIDDVDTEDRILLDDGLIELKIDDIDHDAKEIHCHVLNDGVLKNKKGVNVPGVSVKLPGITEKDREDIIFGIGKVSTSLRRASSARTAMYLKYVSCSKSSLPNISRSFRRSRTRKVSTTLMRFWKSRMVLWWRVETWVLRFHRSPYRWSRRTSSKSAICSASR